MLLLPPRSVGFFGGLLRARSRPSSPSNCGTYYPEAVGAEGQCPVEGGRRKRGEGLSVAHTEGAVLMLSDGPLRACIAG